MPLSHKSLIPSSTATQRILTSPHLPRRTPHHHYAKCPLYFSLQSQPRRNFHQSCVLRQTFKPVWTEARVKVPWVEALERKKRGEDELAGENGRSGTAAAAAAAAAPRLAPQQKKWGGLKAKKEEEEGVKSVEEGKKGPKVVDLTPRKMRDSYYRTILPLAQDPWLLDTYLNASGHIRLGSLLMDLDALAGVVGNRHAGESVALVTAAVDRITIEHPLKEICDLELSGQVTYATGRSSMEVSLQVAKAPQSTFEKVKQEDVLITCAFTMVSLDPVTRRPAPVAPLAVESAEESQLFDQGHRNYNAKKALRKTSLREETPNDEESDLIHAMWTTELAYRDPTNPQKRPENVVYMADTTLRSAQIMQPEYRNRHQFMIFGGYLLKQTFELAFCCVASFSHSRPTFLCLDPSTFDNSVPVGSVLYLKATVSYTDPPLISTRKNATTATNRAHPNQKNGKKFTRVQVRVDSSVRDVEHGTKKPTGMFNYTFLVGRDIQIMPQSYEDFMVWADARRRAQNTDASLNRSLLGGKIREGVTE